MNQLGLLAHSEWNLSYIVDLLYTWSCPGSLFSHPSALCPTTPRPPPHSEMTSPIKHLFLFTLLSVVPSSGPGHSGCIDCLSWVIDGPDHNELLSKPLPAPSLSWHICKLGMLYNRPFPHYFWSWYTGAGGSGVKNLAASEEDTGLIPGLERSPGEGNDNPLQYSCLDNPVDRGVWWAVVHGVPENLDTSYD